MSEHTVHIVHDEHGRILAIASAAPESVADGARRGLTPVPVAGQFAVRLSLTAEHAAAGPVALIRDFEVDVSSAQPRLRPRTER